MKKYYLIEKPLSTEKVSLLQEKNNTYTFSVKPEATKTQIKDLIESIYHVQVLKVRSLNYAGKRKRRVQNKVYQQTPYKKVYVQLKEGQSLQVGPSI